MLKFNTFRSLRYLRSRFVEGKYLLASEATDLELELLDQSRETTRKAVGDVSVNTAWQVSRIDSTHLLISPGNAWYDGLPFTLRSGYDELVTNGLSDAGSLPLGVTPSNSDSGKLLTFTTSSTPCRQYTIVITAQEQAITSTQDLFLQNLNLTESTEQKLRLTYQINVVPTSGITNTPIPYTNDTDQKNLVNSINVTVASSGNNGSIVSTSVISGSTAIDGRTYEITVLNDPSLNGGNPIPNATLDQQVFYNGRLIDTVGQTYHINAIFNDVVTTRVIIRISQEVSQPVPIFESGKAFTLNKKDVYYTDDVNGVPQGKRFYPIANVTWDQTYGFTHSSKIVDLRSVLVTEETFEQVTDAKFNLSTTGGGTVYLGLDASTLSWAADFDVINPAGPTQVISANTAYITEGGTLVYKMNLGSGGVISLGNISTTVSSFSGSTVNLSGSPSLVNANVGNVLLVGTTATEITAIDDINKKLTVSPSITVTGAATIYCDSYYAQSAPQSAYTYTLASRKNNVVSLSNGLQLSAGESTAMYDERTLFPSGLAASTSIVLPNNSRNGNNAQAYDSSKGNLEVWVNQLFKFQGVDWLPIDSTHIEFTTALPNNTEVHFRIDEVPAGVVGVGSGGIGLQGAYNAGASVLIGTGAPITLNGTVGTKLLQVNGDMAVTGVIDPTGLQLTNSSTNPLAASTYGIWVNSSNQLMYEGTSTSNISLRLDNLESGASIALNPTGDIISTGSGLAVQLESTNPTLQSSSNKLGLKMNPTGALSTSSTGVQVNVDSSSIDINGSDQVEIKALGVTSAKLGAIIGNGLQGASGSAISVLTADSSMLAAVGGISVVEDAAGAIITGGSGIKIQLESSNPTLQISSNQLGAKLDGSRAITTGASGIGVNVDNSSLDISTNILEVKPLGISTAKLAATSVTAAKLGSDVAGAGLSGGNGSPLVVSYSPSGQILAVAGTSFNANTTYLVRWALTGETAGRFYKATAATASNGDFLVFGLFNSTSSVSPGTSVLVTTLGALTLGSSDTAFSSSNIGQPVYLKNDGSAGYTLTPSTTPGDAQYQVGIVQTTTSIWVDIKGLSSIVPAPLYNASISYSNGLSANTNITLPSGKTYSPTSYELQVYVNELFKYQGLDWISVDNATIQFSYALPDNTTILFRINSPESGTLTIGGGGGGGSTLQAAYNSGSSITVASGVPLTLNGTSGQDLMVINGNLKVTGVIDPTGVQLLPQLSNPLTGGTRGVWLDNSENLMVQGASTAMNVSQSIINLQSGVGITGISKSYANNSGNTIPAFTPVYSPTAGFIAPADGTNINKFRVIGITTAAIGNNMAGLVQYAGYLSGVTGGLTHNTYIYLGLTAGSLVDVPPTLGSYPSGFEVIRIGVMEGSNLILQIQSIGTL